MLSEVKYKPDGTRQAAGRAGQKSINKESNTMKMVSTRKHLRLLKKLKFRLKKSLAKPILIMLPLSIT
jgi:hypothetical protein